jgi:hypothetical protein
LVLSFSLLSEQWQRSRARDFGSLKKGASRMNKPTEKHDDPEQSKRFIDTAREREADETKEGADKAFKKVAPIKPQSRAR